MLLLLPVAAVEQHSGRIMRQVELVALLEDILVHLELIMVVDQLDKEERKILVEQDLQVIHIFLNLDLERVVKAKPLTVLILKSQVVVATMAVVAENMPAEAEVLVI